ncbi:hypothetical protein [Actinoplanes cyaneus]|nr:hypothetical protein [Actinoplanes cyaneus]MCW2143568.1 hypothetical protein [Actinoplanes cyaneus]
MNEELERDIEVRVPSPQVARVVKDSLERLENGSGGPEMQEIARDLRKGRISLRDLTRSSVYSRILGEQIQRYREWEASLDDEHRRKFDEQVGELYGPTTFEVGGTWQREREDG